MKKLVTFTFCSILFLIIMLVWPTDKEPEPQQKSTQEDIISQYIADNPTYFELDGSTLEVEHIRQSKDWANGQRYIVFLKGNKKGNYWTIYLEDNSVVGVRYGEGEAQIKLL